MREITLVSVVRPLGAVQAVLGRFSSVESRTMQGEFRRIRRAAALGSVSQAVAQLATCPVLIVKP